MEDNPNAPVFADRYLFESVGSDWDRGRSGHTHLVRDLKENRLGVIKRTETISKQLTHSLQNEIRALNALKGLGVPEVYDTSQAVYDSKNYDYEVIEYIDGIRVEKNLDSLDIIERAEIITQLFNLLSQAHQKGIVNGDVDLKHLFWREDKKQKDKKQLVVIDWGNARLDIDPKKKTEFAYDLARAAEIIFSLVTRQGHPPSTGSIALPSSSKLVAGLEFLPIEFQNLCKWAPRTPSDGAAPYTAEELFEVSKEWLKAVSKSKPYRAVSPIYKKLLLVVGMFLGVACLVIALFAIRPSLLNVSSITFTTTSTFTEVSTTIVLTETQAVTETASPTTTPTPTVIIVPTETPTAFPAPLNYSPILAFEDQPLLTEFKLCWHNEVIPSSELMAPEGFNRKIDNTWWIFNTSDGRATEESVKANFANCANNKSVNAMALNTWVTQIQPETENVPGSEFGIFLQGTNGFIREYVLWVDKSEKLHLRIRENAQVVYDDTVLLVNMQSSGRGNVFRQYRIQMFLEMDNHGAVILYLSEADSAPASVQDLNPTQMIPIYAATRPRLDNLQDFGLIGRGRSTEILIWPLVLFQK